MVDSAKLAIFFQKRITIHAPSRDFCRFSHIIADLVTLGFSYPPHPGSHRLSRLAFEGISKCIVTAVTTLQG